MNDNEITKPRPGLYLCSRTSEYNDGKPCEEAFRALVQVKDVRLTSDPKHIPANKGTDGGWYAQGSNHCIENGNICRDVLVSEWLVEFLDLESLQSFVDFHGECVISRHTSGFAKIEIYDDYRE
jgi:hypothetical protein